MIVRDYRLGAHVVRVTVDGDHPAARDLDICIRPVIARERKRDAGLMSSEVLATHLTGCLGFLGFLGRERRCQLVSVVVHDGTKGGHIK